LYGGQPSRRATDRPWLLQLGARPSRKRRADSDSGTEVAIANRTAMLS